MKQAKKILAISGSTRKNSSNNSILKTIVELYKNSLDIQLYDSIDKLPHFNPDLDTENIPQTVKYFRKLIVQADGIIICSPEYVFSIPGTLKNALEWTVSTTVFSDKPFAFIIASASGEKAFESLDLIMNTLLQYKIPDNSKLLIKGVRGKINQLGQVSDNGITTKIKELTDSLIFKIEELKPTLNSIN